MTTYALRQNLNLTKHGTAITRKDYERTFVRTPESITFTLGGWDGKSYDGETRTARILKALIPGCEDEVFVKVGKAVHMIDFENTKIEKATGLPHPTAAWMVDVERHA